MIWSLVTKQTSIREKISQSMRIIVIKSRETRVVTYTIGHLIDELGI